MHVSRCLRQQIDRRGMSIPICPFASIAASLTPWNEKSRTGWYRSVVESSGLHWPSHHTFSFVTFLFVFQSREEEVHRQVKRGSHCQTISGTRGLGSTLTRKTLHGKCCCRKPFFIYHIFFVLFQFRHTWISLCYDLYRKILIFTLQYWSARLETGHIMHLEQYVTWSLKIWDSFCLVLFTVGERRGLDSAA